ncbi:hypothetical protein ACW4TU_18495 [Streptomyces sp. QTS52]
MRRTTLLLAACLALAGCSDSGGDRAASTPSPRPSPSVAPVIPFMKSIEVARFASYETGIPPYQELEVFPPKWCAALDAGHSVEWMFGDGGLYPIGQEWGTQKGDAYQLVLLGVTAYCPKNVAAVTEELRALGEY